MLHPPCGSTKKGGLLHQLIQRESFLAQPTDESADGCQAASELLHIQQSAGYLHPLDGLDLHGVALYAAFGDQETKELVGWYSENALLRVELDLESAQILKCFLEVLQQGSTLLCLHHHVIYVDVGVSGELLEEALLHATLKGGAGIPQAERHRQVAEGPKRRDEGGLQSVCRVQLDLVIPWASRKLNSSSPAVESIT